MPEAPNHETGADEEDERHGDLCDDETALSAHLTATCSAASPALFQRGLGGVASTPERHQSEDDRGRQGNNAGECDDREIQAYFMKSGNVPGSEGDHAVEPECRKPQPETTAKRGQRHALDEGIPGQLSPTGAQGGPDGQLSLPTLGSDQK